LWHGSCLACEVCGTSLTNETIRTADGVKPFCPMHYATDDQIIIDEGQHWLNKKETITDTSTAEADEVEFNNPVPMDTEDAAKSRSTFGMHSTALTTQVTEGSDFQTMLSSKGATRTYFLELAARNIAPELWSIDQVSRWLSSVDLHEFSEAFRQNEIDGSLLLSDGLDDGILTKLIPQIKSQIRFNAERKKLRTKQQEQALTNPKIGTDDIHIKLQSVAISDTVPTKEISSSDYKKSFIVLDAQSNNIQGWKSLPAG
ncbi:unnamed protein product, partial [Adineta ricciae]